MKKKKKCSACDQGMEAVMEQQQDDMEKYGWYAHYVFDDPQSPLGWNAHTHGLVESFQHPDLQIVLPLPPEVCHDIFTDLVKMVKGGEKLKFGKYYEKIIKNFPVTIATAQECGRPVFRVIFPDKNGNLDGIKMDPQFAKQWQGCEAIN